MASVVTYFSASPTLGLDENKLGLPILGYPGTEFWMIHIIALVSIAISIICSLGVIIYLMLWQKSSTSFWKKTISERLVLYIAIGDFLFSTNHALDHSAYIILINHPGDNLCSATGFFLVWFFFVQTLIVLFTAINAAGMVVLRKKLNLGQYDWRFLVIVFGLPLIPCIILAALDAFGPTGAWCAFDLTKPNGHMIFNIISIYLLCVFILMILSYGGIWLKIRKGSKIGFNTTADDKALKYNKSAKVMTTFVLAFILQFTPTALLGLWLLIKPVLSIGVVLTAACIGNLGGLINLITYTIIRKRFVSGKVEHQRSDTGGETTT